MSKDEWDEAYEKGYWEGIKEREKLKQRVGQLEGLIAANYRVMKQEIEKQVRAKDIQSVKES